MTSPRFDPGTPYHRAELGAALARLTAEGTAYLEALPEAVFFAPQGDRWSPAEHLRHLRKSTAPVARAMSAPKLVLRFRFGTHSAPSRAFIPLRDAYRARLADGVQAGPFAPGADNAPRDAARRRAIMQAWQGSVADLTTAAARWSEPALDRYRLPHPALGQLSMREMLEFTAYHTSHHLNLVAARLDP